MPVSSAFRTATSTQASSRSTRVTRSEAASMKRDLALRFVLLSLLLLASAPAGAKAYKCIVDGKTVFQDHPCSSPAPASSAPAPTAAVAAPPAQRSPEQIFDEIQMVERHLRELDETHKAEA